MLEALDSSLWVADSLVLSLCSQETLLFSVINHRNVPSGRRTIRQIRSVGYWVLLSVQVHRNIPPEVTDRLVGTSCSQISLKIIFIHQQTLR